MKLSVPPAVDLLGAGWVLSVALPGLVQPVAPGAWAAAVAVATGTVAYRVMAWLQPGSPVARSLVWTCGALVGIAVLAVTGATPADITRLSLFGVAAAVAGVTLPAPTAVATTLLLQGWQVAWSLVAHRELSLTDPPLPASLLVAAVSCAVAALVARAIGRGRQRIDGMVAGLLADRRTLRADEARDRARREARADLHDTVLATLTAVGGGWLHGADPDDLREEFRRTADVLVGREQPRDGRTELLETLRSTAAAPRFAGLQVDVMGSGPIMVEGPIAEAVRLAAGEALTNVQRHAGVQRATVQVSSGSGRVRVSVQDAGRGLPSGPSAGLGLPHSVASRLAGVGGSGQVRKVVGGGTEVLLDAPVDTPAATPALPSLWSGAGPRTAARWLIAATLAIGVAGVILQTSIDAVLASALLFPGVACLLLLAADLFGRAGRPPVALVGIAGPVAILLSVRSADGCTVLATPPLAVALAALLAGLVIALLQSAREAVAWSAITVGSYLTAAWLVDGHGPACSAAALALAALHASQVGAAVVVLGALRARAEEARRDVLADQSAGDDEQDTAVRTDERGRLFPVVRTAVLGTVVGLSRGELDPHDPAVRRRCQRDARLVRSLLADTLDGDEVLGVLVARAVALRSQGIDLAVQGGLAHWALRPAQQEQVVAVFDTVCAELVAGRWQGDGEVTVVTTGDDAVVTLVAHAVPASVSAASMALVASPTEGTNWRLHVEVVDGSLWVTHRLSIGEGVG